MPPTPHIAADSKSFAILRGNLRKVAEFARSRPDLFNPGKERKNALLAREDKLAVWTPLEQPDGQHCRPGPAAPRAQKVQSVPRG
ncbi:MAG: hypothetical protein JJE30_02505 [Desulfuromonadales bacterium]|nr:hypothetical protein [Desulfuromonadales bacterium]